MPRPQLFDLDDVGAAGLEVVATGGWSAVSVRSVADELGVSPMALYRLAPDATRLRRAIADAAAESMRPGAGTLDLLDGMSDWARRTYAHLARYPGLPAYVIVEWTELPRWLDIVEALLAQAKARGVAGPKAVALVNSVYAFVLVRCQLRDNASAGPRRRLAPVRADRERYPLIGTGIKEFTTARTDKHFRFGLEVLMHGLETQLPTTRPTRPTAR